MARYNVSLDGVIKARGLSFRDAVRIATDLARSIGFEGFTSRIRIEEA